MEIEKRLSKTKQTNKLWDTDSSNNGGSDNDDNDNNVDNFKIGKKSRKQSNAIGMK